jgi:hypothetical protein
MRESIKKNLQMFDSMYTTKVHVKTKNVALKADRKLVARVVAAIKAWRIVDVKKC